MNRYEQPSDCSRRKESSEHGDRDTPDQRYRQREQDAEDALCEEKWADRRLVPVAVGPKVQMDGRGREEQGRADDDHEADHGSGRPTPCTHSSPGVNITVAAHAAPTRHPGHHLPRSYLHRTQNVDG